MYVTGLAGVVLVVLAVLLMVGVVPVTSMVVGGMFLLVALGLAGPYVVRT